MKKILVVFTGSVFPEGALRFATTLNQPDRILLTGVFVPETVLGNTYSFTTGLPMAGYSNMISDEEEKAINTNIRRFSAYCESNDVDYHIHQDYSDLALATLRTESRFADVMIISSEKFFERHFLNDPNPSLKEVLHEAECPVFVIPESFEKTTGNIVAYDGSSSSVHAIKQFAYLFPKLCQNETTFIYLNEKNDKSIPNERNLKELVSQHFKNASVLKLDLSRDEFFDSWLKQKRDFLLITGSYSRSGVSALISESFASDAVEEYSIPVFIAHK
jgi:hypothetical protein